MLDNNIAQTYANAQEKSWIDDPFDLKGSFAGVANMNIENNLNYFAQELVAHYAKYEGQQYILNLSDLSEFDQNELARLYIESTGRELTECVNGDDFSIDNEYTCALLNMLQNDCKETRDYFAQITKSNILKYYKKSLQDVIDDACIAFQCNLMTENDDYAYQDKNNGEVIWSTFR